MADPGRYRRDDAETGSAAAATGRGTPRWVKVAGVIALVILVMLVVALLSGGKHGPGQHVDTGARASPAVAASSVADDPAPAPGAVLP